MTFYQSLSAAGFAATAIGYGPARMGFGLFVPEFRETFELSTSTIGFISSLGFFGFLLGLLLAQLLLNLRGPEAPVVVGLAAAAAGMAIIAAAPGPMILAGGVFLAATSAGFAWTPFNDAVHRKVRQSDRPAALATVSTGTSFGVCVAGLTALGPLVGGISWRYCWAGFAAAAVLVLIGNLMSLRQVEKSPHATPRGGWRHLRHGKARPLFLTAFVFGTSSAIYIAFAADHARGTGGPEGLPAAAAPALIFVSYGIFGLIGLGAGRLRARLGLSRLLRLSMAAGACSALLIAFAATSWAGLIASAGLQGIHVMVTSALIASWSEELFPSLPSLSFTAALLAMAAGSVLGAALGGVAADAVGPAIMFLGAALLPAAAALLLRGGAVREEPIASEE
ncbi:MFS transporter [Profundibacterium mesophilum]|uniref:Major Facilitator Superfamily domain containing protein n=1 Tax=Profundibacterium mesophilum KAUST100406-0324 TaxID=1037889 RepID=A0A921NWC9_9RHOB|nr:MFS transporter [Profundibacterium mesophilum]KAF0676675.1 Major Facilitator Superfamily domain containing protein [Profundibacterium mesophilum KAUST100406-0324]